MLIIPNRNSAKRNGDNNCVGTRKKKGNGEWGEYEWKTYKQVKKKSEDFGSGLMGLGLKPVSTVTIILLVIYFGSGRSCRNFQ